MKHLLYYPALAMIFFLSSFVSAQTAGQDTGPSIPPLPPPPPGTDVLIPSTNGELSYTSTSQTSKIDINGKITNPLACNLSITNPYLELTIPQNRIPNFDYYISSRNLTTWNDRSQLPDYNPELHEFNIKFECNHMPSTYNLKIDTTNFSAAAPSGTRYNTLLVNRNPVQSSSKKVGFIALSSRSNELLSLPLLQSSSGQPIQGFSPTECSTANARQGQMGYCSMDFKIASMLFAADTSGAYGSTNPTVPSEWITENSYTLNLVVSIEFN